MAISVYCEQCKETYKVKDELAGKRGKCKNGHVLMIPQAGGAADTSSTAALGASLKKPKPQQSAAKSQKCPSCQAALVQEAVLCVDCGFDLRTGRKIGSPPASKVKLVMVLLLAGGVAALFAVVAIGAAAFFLWPRGGATSPLAQNEAAQKPPSLDAKPNVPPGGDAQAIVLPGGDAKPNVVPVRDPESKAGPISDANSRLTISDAKAVTADGDVKVTVACAWSGKPNPEGYKTGHYRFETPVSEVNGMKVKTPDIQQGTVTFDAKLETARFELTPETSLKSAAALIGKIHLRIGESNEVTIDASKVTAGVSAPPTPGGYPKDLIGVWLAKTDAPAKQTADAKVLFEFQPSGDFILTSVQGKDSNQVRGKWFYKQDHLSTFLNGQKGKPLPVRWVNADEFSTTSPEGGMFVFQREGKGVAKIDAAPGAKEMHYTVQGDLVRIHNTPWNQPTFKMTLPPGSSGGTGTVYVGDKLEPRIRVVYDRNGVSAVTVDGKAIPRGK